MEKQHELGLFVNNNIFVNQTSLVGKLFEDGIFDYDEIENYYPEITKEDLLDCVEPDTDEKDFKKTSRNEF